MMSLDLDPYATLTMVDFQLLCGNFYKDKMDVKESPSFYSSSEPISHASSSSLYNQHPWTYYNSFILS